MATEWEPGEEIDSHIIRNVDESYDMEAFVDYCGTPFMPEDSRMAVDLKFVSGTALLGLSMLPARELRRLGEFLVEVADKVDVADVGF
jgi:hypothetical protein